MFCIIYKIINKIDGKCYVGQTWQPIRERFMQHCSKNDSIKLFNALAKHGRNNFIVECLTITHTQEIADQLEIYFIKKFKSNIRDFGYNISNGGTGVGKHTPETKRKISDSLSGRELDPFTDEHKENMSMLKVGHVVSDETKSKISAALLGRKLSDEHITNIGKGHTGLTYIIKDPDQHRRNISAGKKKKITDEQILEMLDKFTAGVKPSELAHEYGLSVNHVRNIVSGRKRRLTRI